MPDTPPPTVVWADDLDPRRRPPQTDPPLHAERRASEVFDRVAGVRRRRPWYRRAGWGYVVGLGLMAAGGAVGWWQLDLALMRVPTVALVGVGFGVVVKTLMGYR
jgi:hypothetical protein